MSILSSKPKVLQDKVNNSPKEPGCYMYLNKKGKIIYVGKAKVLRNRLKSYFINYPHLDKKTQAMIDLAVDVDTITVDSEIEALILETNLIKKYRPKYNIMMRDDKSYVFIKLEKPIKNVRDFPRIKMMRKKEDDKAEYLGPYPDSLPLKNILKRIRKIWPYVSCNRRLVQTSSNPLKVDTNNNIPCLYYHLGLCQAPCASLISKQEYAKDFGNIKKFLKGEKKEIIHTLESEMSQYSKQQNFEEAALLRDKINDIKYVTQNISIDKEVDDVMVTELKEKERAEALNQLIEQLRFPSDKLKYHEQFRIECYDISNIQGTNSVGSMTVMINGKLRPDLYRRFRIRGKPSPSPSKGGERIMKPNDYAMLQEVLERRFAHFGETGGDPSFSHKPDLIIIDGGKGQLASTFKILRNLELDREIPIVGLAKREEEIFKIEWQFSDDDFASEGLLQEVALKKFKRIYLTRRSEALFLVQRIRDEAHRFGITYHRKLRSRKMLEKQNQPSSGAEGASGTNS